MRNPRISSLRRGRHTAIKSFASILDRPGGLFSLDARYLDWPSPLLDIGLLEDIERLRGLSVARWNVLSEIGKPLAHQRIGHAAKDAPDVSISTRKIKTFYVTRSPFTTMR
jgi:hypothetical protein